MVGVLVLLKMSRSWYLSLFSRSLDFINSSVLSILAFSSSLILSAFFSGLLSLCLPEEEDDDEEEEEGRVFFWSPPSTGVEGVDVD